MDFSYSEEQEQIRRVVRDFAEKEVRPGVQLRERERAFDHSLLKRLGDLGVCGILYPEEFGGLGTNDILAFSLAQEEIGRVDYAFSFGDLAAVMNPLLLSKMCDDEQTKRWKHWFEAGAKGEITGALAVTEPDAGSNVQGIQTTAVQDNGEWVINGTKVFITCAGDENCPYAMVLAVTDRTNHEADFFVVPKGTPGFSVGTRYDLLGIKSVWNGEISFADCRVPLENRVGPKGKGFVSVSSYFKMMAPIRAGAEIGLQRACFEIALAYAKERKAFGQTIGKYQHVQQMLVEMEANLEISCLLRNKAAVNLQNGKSALLERSRLKWITTEAAITASKYAVEVFGGIGLTEETPAARLYRDARMSNIPGGTSEVHKWNMARELGC